MPDRPLYRPRPQQAAPKPARDDYDPLRTDIDKLLDELDKYLIIDKHDLDNVSAGHAELVRRINERYELEISRRDTAIQAEKEISAEVALELRKAAAEDGEKITDKTVEAMVTVDDRVKKANARILQIKLNVGKLKSTKEGFEARGYQIANLKDMFVSNYYNHQIGDAARNRAAADRQKQILHEGRTLRRQREMRE